MRRANWLKSAVARRDGYYSVSGEKLKGKKLTQAECDEWNNAVAKPFAAPVKQKKKPVEGVLSKLKRTLFGH